MRNASAALALATLLVCGCGQAADSATNPDSGTMRITSPAFAANAAIPRRFSCQGAETSPPLHWHGVPANARSLALIVDDPDAPGGTWVHWVVYNLPAGGNGLDENADASDLPGKARDGTNSWHNTGYGGMCPPSGSHHYRFKLYALDTTLHLDKPDKAGLRRAMQGHVLARAELKATYRKH